MKAQTPYKGSENKKVKLTKADKVYNFLQKKKRMEDANKKKETV